MRKWKERENGKRMRKQKENKEVERERENGERMRKWRENKEVKRDKMARE